MPLRIGLLLVCDLAGNLNSDEFELIICLWSMCNKQALPLAAVKNIYTMVLQYMPGLKRQCDVRCFRVGEMLCMRADEE